MLKEEWTKTCKYIKEDKPEDYQLWIQLLKYISSKNNHLYLAVSNTMIMDRIKSKYYSYIKKVMDEIANQDIKIHINVDDSISFKKKIEETYMDADDEAENEYYADDDDQELSLFDKRSIKSYAAREKVIYESRLDDDSKALHKDEGETGSLTQNIRQIKAEDTSIFHPLLHSKFTFERFVVGENNKMASEAVMRVIDALGKNYNPLYIYGGVGLGKTHLMQAAGHRVYRLNIGYKILYSPCEKFMYEFSQMIRNKQQTSFRIKYRNADLLLIDDIHLLNSNEKMQQELFDIFNKLKDSSKQMIFTCDRPIYELKNLTDRLVSRIGSGLHVAIKPPNFETRKNIIRKKSTEVNLNLSEDIIEYMASNITSNVRYIEAAIARLHFVKEYSSVPKISLSIAMQELKNIIFSNSQANQIDIDNIKKVVADYYNISVNDIISNKKKSTITKPRHIAIYLSKKLSNLSLKDIGTKFGNRKHTTIMASVDKIEKELKENPSIRNDYEQIVNKLQKN